MTEQDAMIADLQLSNMRLHEELAGAQKEVWTLRKISAQAALLVYQIENAGGPAAETIAMLEELQQKYFESKIVNSRSDR